MWNEDTFEYSPNPKLSEQQSDYYNLHQLQKKNKASLCVYQQGKTRVNKILNLSLWFYKFWRVP
jgi:hypothetical protein